MTSTTSKKVRVPDLALMKQRGDRIVMLTAYDATMARLLGSIPKITTQQPTNQRSCRPPCDPQPE